jgi:fatty acid desaturase
MRYSSVNRGFPAGNPLANALVIVVGTLVIAASIVLGFVVFVILGSVLLVIAAIFGVRLWWFRHRMTKSAAHGGSKQRTRDVGRHTIEGEYHVVVDERDREPPGAA